MPGAGQGDEKQTALFGMPSAICCAACATSRVVLPQPGPDSISVWRGAGTAGAISPTCALLCAACIRFHKSCVRRGPSPCSTHVRARVTTAKPGVVCAWISLTACQGMFTTAPPGKARRK